MQLLNEIFGHIWLSSSYMTNWNKKNQKEDQKKKYKTELHGGEKRYKDAARTEQ